MSYYYGYPPNYGYNHRQDGNQAGTGQNGQMGNGMDTVPGGQMETAPGGQMGAPPAGQVEEDIMTICQKYMNFHVIGHMSDGSQMEGILEAADDNSVTLLVPEDVYEDERIYGGYGGYGRRRFRRFRRRRFPLNFFVFPFFLPFPYYF